MARVWSCIVSAGQTWTVGVTGATGYAGGEVCRLLAGHPNLRLAGVHANSSAGRRLGELQPHLLPFADMEVQPSDPAALAGYDVVVLALPHGESAAVAAQLPDDTLVIDCGADHRLNDPAAWARWYGGEHAGSWPYGLPELPGQREKLAGARRIAVPGCYPTSVTLALAPALAAGLVEPEVVVVAASGTSGAGKSAKPHLLGSEVMGSVSAYGVGGVHRHTPEMIQNLSQAAGHAGERQLHPDPRADEPGHPRHLLGEARARARTPTAARAAYEKAYADEPFVHLLPEGQWPTTAQVLGANTVALQVAVDPDAGRLVVVAAVDNLTKGTGGAAIQCANLALGLPETTGLPARRSSAVSVTAPQGFSRRRCRRRAQVLRRPRRRRRPQPRPGRRRGRRLHHQPLPGRAGAVEPAGAGRRAGAGHRPQLRRRQRLHRARGLPGHPRHRRARRGASSASARSTSRSPPPG